jgi:hypothetical protein
MDPDEFLAWHLKRHQARARLARLRAVLWWTVMALSLAVIAWAILWRPS